MTAAGPQPRIFISYRRDDSQGFARSIHDRLAQHFGPEAVFRDINDIEPGLPWEQAIDEALASCDVFVLLIGRHWLEATDDEGNRRIDNPEDRHRREIETAINRRIRIFVALMEDAHMPRKKQLPPVPPGEEPRGVQLVPALHALRIADFAFDYGVEELITNIERAAEQARVSEAPQREAAESRRREAEEPRRAEEEEERKHAEGRAEEQRRAETEERSRAEEERKPASEPAATAPRGGGGGSGMLTRPGAAVGDHVSLLLRSASRGALPLAVVQSRPTPAVTPAAPVEMREPFEAGPAGAPMQQRVLTRGLVLAGASIAAVAAAIAWAIGCALDLPLDEDDEADDDIVDCTVFAPPSARTGDRLLVQVFVHLPVDAEIARALATEWDTAAKRRAVKSLEVSIARGSRLGFQLEMPGAEVDEPVQSLRWDGRAQAVQFGVFLPATLDSSVLIGTVSASLNSVPIGHVKFKLALDADRAVSEEAVGDDARRYRSAFISYASQDRNEVLRSAQGLRAAGVRCFQDVLDLEPGERWERKLYLKIREGDLFVLFWSSAARDSEWVRKEAQYALDCKTSDLDPPEIKPIIVADPPVPKPWPELAHLHFNDPAIYLMSR
jgi:TIR domain